MKILTILVGPPGSGKTTYRNAMLRNDPTLKFVSQDEMGKVGHWEQFQNSVVYGESLVVDRMNFDTKQRAKYLVAAKAFGYHTKIIVLHENQATCLERMLARKGHETIQDEKSARSALHTFFSKYERPQPGEADEIQFNYPEGEKPSAVICDLDGTLCNIDHRLHFVRGEGKKDWKNFMYNIPGDSINDWCAKLLWALHLGSFSPQIVYCSGRGGEYRGHTKQWLVDNNLFSLCENKGNLALWVNERIVGPAPHLYMRERGDSRPDTQIKENILDFEILTRFTPLFAVDDRPSVCRMWRSRGITCLQCNDKEF